MTHEEVRLVYPHYNNTEMLKLQIDNWSRLSGDFRKVVRIIVVDDCSTVDPTPMLKGCKADVRVFRLQQRIPWNMHQCRNIGAKEACKALENHWLYMSDIDIMITPEVLYTMMDRKLDPGKYYTVERTFAPDFVDRKVHPNTFLVKHRTFWQVNGYDLDLTPVGGGGYGGDNQFVRQMANLVGQVHLEDVVTIGFGRRSRDGQPVIPDADTTDLDRASWHGKYAEALARKKKLGDLRSMNPIRTPYVRTL